MTIRRSIATLILLALAPLSAPAAERTRLNAFTQPHVLRYSAAEDIDGLNPVLSSQGVVSYIGELTMAWLFRWNHENRPEPELATVVPTKANGGVSADGRTITYHLRRGVKWSDGQPFSSADVKFSFDVMNNPRNNVTSRDGFDRVTRIDTPRDDIVVVHLRAPYSLFIATFFATGSGSPCLLPKHILGTLPEINDAPYNALPVGIGPFRFTAWRRGDSVEMEANPNYWRGLPKLHKIIYKIIPSRNTVLTELQSGDLDLWVPFGGVFKSRVEAIPGFALGRHLIYTYDHIDLNVSRPALRDRVVRQALRLATDRRKQLEIGHGVGALQESVLPAPYPGVPKLPLVPYDIARANALLDGAGWKRGADGVRVKDGVRLSLEFVGAVGSPDSDLTIELIRSEWQQIGVAINVKRYLPSQLFESYANGGILYGGKFDAFIYATGLGAIDNLGTGYECKLIPPAGQNTTRYCNPKADALMEDFLTRYDFPSQSRDLTQIVRIINEDVPAIVLRSREELWGYNRDITGLHPGNATFFDDMMNVDI